MKYVNIDSLVFDQPEFSEATLEQIGLWLKLYAACARHESGGYLTTAGNWSDAHCRRVLNCSRKDLDNSPLWHIKPGGCLDVYFYNIQAEDFSKKRRRISRRAGQQRSEVKSAAARENGAKGGRPRKIINLPAQG